jgi:endonuclease V-like protein UPF0215 family
VKRKHPLWSHVVGFDDAPFPPTHRGNVPVVGAVYAGERLDGVLSCLVRRDGVNATTRLAACLRRSRFYPQLDAVLLQGIAFAGFNVIDIHALSATLARPVLVIVRRRPNLAAIRSALGRVRGGARKWQLIERAGPTRWHLRRGSGRCTSPPRAPQSAARAAAHGPLDSRGHQPRRKFRAALRAITGATDQTTPPHRD